MNSLAEKLVQELSVKNYNPMNDVLFKFIFGKEERKRITIDFLNAVLEQSPGADFCSHGNEPII